MDAFERELRRCAMRTGREVTTACAANLLGDCTLEPLASGVFHRVFRIAGQPWVIKEARWDPAIPMGTSALPLPASSLDAAFRQFSGGLLPNADEAMRQYEEYRIFAEYFGWFADIEESESYPDGERLIARQREVRASLTEHLGELERHFGAHFPTHMTALLNSPIIHRNFLPREYLLWGPSVSSENGGKETAFIVQEYVEGKELHDMPPSRTWPSAQRDQFLLLCYLILLLHMERCLVPDTRPRALLTPQLDWLEQTDNILCNADGLTFVDTRWLWHTDGNFLRRGVVIPELVAWSCWNAIRE